MIKVLKNPKTQDYLGFKEWVTGPDFTWNYNVKTTNSTIDLPFYTHAFIKRPETEGYPKIDNPQETEGVVKMLMEILKYNNVAMNSFIRISVNAVHPEKRVISSLPHVDHQFNHGNLLMYFTDAGGSTFVEGEEHNPKEDDIILFTGEHYMETPTDIRRVILVATMV